jgi:predicted glycoside hydrolase/deacetylase ChbG (UPF0249 family)
MMMKDETKRRIHANTIMAIEQIARETGTPLDLSQTQVGAEIVAIRARLAMTEKSLKDAHDRILQLLDLSETAADAALRQNEVLTEVVSQVQALKTVMGFDDDLIDEDGNPPPSH